MVKRYLGQFLNLLNLRYSLKDLKTLFQLLLSSKVNNDLKVISYKVETRVISLPSRHDRRKNMISLIGKTEEKLFFDAIGYNEISIKNLSEKIISKRSKLFLSEGSIACILSHVLLWIELTEADVQSYLILEDDVTCTVDYLKIKNATTKLPFGFDLVILGNQLDNVYSRLSIEKNSFYRPWICSRGSYSYVISKKGVSNILKLILPVDITAGGIDTLIGREIRSGQIQSYRVHKDLFKVDFSFPSDILNPEKPNKKMYAFLPTKKNKDKYGSTIAINNRIHSFI